MNEDKYRIKRRNPILSAFLSLISLGLGQVYNGEFLKGVLLKAIFCVALCLYAFLSFIIMHDFFLLSALLTLFVVLKVYSIGQAFMKSRRVGVSYRLKILNKSYVYVLLTIIFFVLSVVFPLTISRHALMDMSAHHPFKSAKTKELYLKSYEKMTQNWPIASETRMIETSYGQTFVRINGPAEAPPLVLLPGANATSLMWFPNIEALSKSYRTYAVDNIFDFGRSVFTRRFETSDDFVQWLDELFKSLELGDSIKLMGLSYGGWLTSQYAIRFPERIDKIVLLAPAATVLPFRPEFLKNATLSLIPHRKYVEKTMFLVLDDLVNKDEAGRAMVEELVEQMYLAQRCFKPKMLPGPTVLTDEEWQNIKIPALYLVGENEKIYAPQEAIQRLNRLAPHIKTELIPNAGHDLTVVQADIVNRIVLDFLNQI